MPWPRLQMGPPARLRSAPIEVEVLFEKTHGRLVMKPVLLLILLALAACKRPDTAEGDVEGLDLDGLSRYIFSHNKTADDKVLGKGLASLETWLDTFVEGGAITTTTPLHQRSWTIEALDDDDVKTLPKRPARPISATKGSAVAYLSPYKIECHAALQTIVDERAVEPTAKRYDRTFINQEQPTCFIDGDCPTLQTSNSVRRENPIFWAEFTLWKDFRWVSYEKDGAARRAFISRGWFAESSDGPDGPEGSQLWQSYDVDVWIERGGEVLRYEVVWTETELYIVGIRVDADAELSTLSGATDGVFTAGDQYIKDTLIPADACKN